MASCTEIPLTVFVRRATIFLLGALALWNSWECRVLFSDGGTFLGKIVENGGFFDYGTWARQYAIGVTQLPLVVGLKLGVTDLRWLSFLFSIGAFGLPTILYQMALMRARSDVALLAAVVATIALVFMTTSFFIVGEYNTAYALAIVMATWVATSDRPRVIDGVVLVGLAILAVRTYEVFIYLGPLLAAMIVWQLSRYPSKPRWLSGDSMEGRFVLMGLPVLVTMLAFQGFFLMPLLMGGTLAVASLAAWRWRSRRADTASALYVLAAALLLAAALVAADSSRRNGGSSEFQKSVFAFWSNLQFDLAFAGVSVIFVWWLAKPSCLTTNRPYFWAGLPLALLAASPLLYMTDVVHPINSQHYLTRTFAGLLVAGIICCIWTQRGGSRVMDRVFGLLRKPEIARRCLRFLFVMLLAVLPSEVLATKSWVSFLDTARIVVRTHQGVIAYEDLPLALHRYYWWKEELEVWSEFSQLLRSQPGDAIIAVPRTMNASELPDLGRFFWRDQP